MGKVFIQEDTLQGIADSIREKNGSTDRYNALQMVSAIQNISTGTPPIAFRLPYGTYFVPNNVTCTLNIRVNGELPVYLFYTNVNEESICASLVLGTNTFYLKPYSWFLLYYPNDNGQSQWYTSEAITPETSTLCKLDLQEISAGKIIPFSDEIGIGMTYTSTLFIPSDDYYGSGSPPAPSQTISLVIHTSSAACFLKGTKITLSNGTYKNCEDITFDDELLVWDFYNGCFAQAKTMFIMKPQKTNNYIKLTFDDGTEVCYTGHKGYHRIFNEQAGKFTSTKLDDTPVGTTTFKDNSTKPKLISKELINEECEYYNIITDKHYNCFTNGILASCKISNTHPIIDMKYTDKVLLDNNYVKEYIDKIKNKTYWIYNK